MAAEDVVVTLSQRGYIKRQQIGTFRSQRRGGKGKLAMITREEDAVRHLLVANTHDHILFFTNRGRVFITRVPPCRGQPPGQGPADHQPAGRAG